MKPLLKDLPGFSERIETNFGLIDEISTVIRDIEIENDFKKQEDSVVSDIVEVLTRSPEFRIVGDRVEIDNKQELAQEIWNSLKPFIEEGTDFVILNVPEVSALIISSITNFVNENYQVK